MNIQYEVVDDYDYIFDEKGNTFLSLRKISWGGREAKLDLRKWYIDKEGNETVGKGMAFLTEEGPNELTKVLVENGFGDTNELLEALSKRSDFNKQKYDLSNVGSSEEYYDINSIFEEEI